MWDFVVLLAKYCLSIVIGSCKTFDNPMSLGVWLAKETDFPLKLSFSPGICMDFAWISSYIFIYIWTCTLIGGLDFLFFPILGISDCWRVYQNLSTWYITPLLQAASLEVREHPKASDLHAKSTQQNQQTVGFCHDDIYLELYIYIYIWYTLYTII